jgi:hypothetical protein
MSPVGQEVYIGYPFNEIQTLGYGWELSVFVVRLCSYCGRFCLALLERMYSTVQYSVNRQDGVCIVRLLFNKISSDVLYRFLKYKNQEKRGKKT